MKKSELFKIGEIAKMFHLSVGTLRHYEKNGLIKPAYIDNGSGYRYYSTQHFEVLNTIRYLRTLDMPLEEIREFLENRNISSIQNMLKSQRERVIEKQKELKIIEKKINNRLEYLEGALNSEFDKIVLKKIKEKRVVWLKNNFEIETYIDNNFEKSIRKLERNQKETAVFLGKIGLGISKEKLLKKNFKSYDRIFLILDKEDNYNGETEVIPSEMNVTLRFCGIHKDAQKYYQKLSKYIEENNLEILGFSKEISMIDYGLTNDTTRFVTEIQIPIKQQNKQSHKK